MGGEFKDAGIAKYYETLWYQAGPGSYISDIGEWHLWSSWAKRSRKVNIDEYHHWQFETHFRYGALEWENAHDMGAAYRSLLGYAPQQQGLYDTFTGIRFLSYMATLKGISKKEQKGEIQRVLDYVNLTEKAYRPIGTYSGGMKQRILVAQAILGDPHLVVLDEPTAGLDPKERVRIRENIRNISGDKIILVSTHVVSDIESIAKEIILLREGKIVDHDTVPSLCKNTEM